MSFAKFGPDSDIYLYGGVTDPPPDDTHVIVCSLCIIPLPGDPGEEIWDRPSREFLTKQDLFAHLDEHRAAGHRVPDSAITAIEEDDWL